MKGNHENWEWSFTNEKSGISQILVKKPFSLQPICGWNVCQYTDLQGIYDYKIHPEVKSVICSIEQQLDQEIQVRKWKQKGYG